MNKLKYTPGPWEYNRTHARLIAAAPEMLECLIELHEAMNFIGVHKYQNKIKNLIEKATGLKIEEVLG